jgi:hypothetical protein
MRNPTLALIVAAACLPSPVAALDEGEEKKPPAARPAESPPEKEPAKETGKDPAKEPAREPAREKAKEAATPAAPAVKVRAPRSKEEALRLLDRIVLPAVTFDATPLRQAVEWLSAATGVNMILGPALLKESDPDAIRLTLTLRKVTAKQVLDLVADGNGLGIGFKSGVLLVTTKKEARGKPVLRLYLVSDITSPLRDFPAPDLLLRPAGSEHSEEPETESKPAFSSADDVLSLVKDNTGEGTWEDGEASASTMGETLVVRQYAEVHAEIADLLAKLRAAR